MKIIINWVIAAIIILVAAYLVPGVAVEIMGRAPFNGPMRLRVGREDVVIGYELMKSLWVT